VGFELIGGDYWDTHGGKVTLGYILIATVEEALEMAGVILFIYGLLTYLADKYSEVRFLLDERRREDSRTRAAGV
jgi:hypothetical protein